MKVKNKVGYSLLGIMLILLVFTSLSDSSDKGTGIDNKTKSAMVRLDAGIGFSSDVVTEGDYEMHLLSITNAHQAGEYPINQCGCSQCSGQESDGTGWNFTAIGADFLQDKGLSGKGIKVALFDTGIDLNNSDLNIAGGVSFIDGVESYADDNGHGTAMAGILAAQKNGSGMLGVAPEVELYSVKVLDKNGIGKYSNIIQGIEWAIDNDIDIITLSLGGTQYSNILSDEIDKAVNNNILIIAAAGNEGKEETMYPAAFSQVVSVGASDINQQITDFSNYGDTVDITAPGVDIIATEIKGGLTTISGTSASVQQVAGVAALLWSSDGTLTNENIKRLLLNNSLYLTNQKQDRYREINAILSYKKLLEGNCFVIKSDKAIKSPGDNKAEALDADYDGTVFAQAACKHTSTTSSTTPATCASAGQVVTSCRKCGKTLSTITIPALGHNWKTTSIVGPFCTTAAVETRTCTRCGVQITFGGAGATGHHWTQVGQAPTCTERGFTYNECSWCGSTTGFQWIEAPGHSTSYSLSGYHTPEYGHYFSVYCSRCRKEINSGYHHDTYTTTGPHTASGHLVQVLCYDCGLVESSYYSTVATCLSCTTAPLVSLINPTGNSTLSEADTNFIPQIRVSDEESDSITCNYYLDGSANSAGTITVASTRTGTVANFTTPINIANLSEGSHTIRVTAKDPIAPSGQASVTFLVDKSAPTINSVTSTVISTDLMLTVSASDTQSGLSETAFRYTMIGRPATDWMSSASCPFTGLNPNTSYSYQVEVRDKAGHITTYTGSVCTAAETPAITLTALSENKVQVQRTDTNPADTLYCISVLRGSTLLGYLNATGTVTTDQSWIPFSSLTAAGLAANTAYTFSIAAKTADSHMTDAVSENIITSPAVPANLTATAVSSSSIRISWNNSAGATSYEIFKEILNSSKAVVHSDTLYPQSAQSYEDNAVSEKQIYRYKIRSKDSRGLYSAWSVPAEVLTPQAPPAKITQIAASVSGSVINLSWTSPEGAVGYLVKYTYDGMEKEKYSVGNQVSYDTEHYNCQCSYTVKAFNVCSSSDPQNTALWKNAGVPSDAGIIQTNADIPTIKPVSPAGITTNSIEVSWQTNHNPDSVSYILVVNAAGKPSREISTVNNHYVVTGLEPETAYTFKVKALNSYQIATSWSGEVSAKTLIDYPSVPMNQIATSMDGYIVLSWKPSDHAQSYKVERDGVIIASVLNTTTYQDNNINPDTSYTYRVKAVNTTGESSWCQPLVKKSLGELPGAPTITSVTGSSISLRVDWSTVNGATGYDIEVDNIIHNMGLETSYEHNGLLPGSEHKYRVRARNIFGKSVWSELNTIRTKQVIPDAPAIITADATDTILQLGWTAVSGAAFYVLKIDNTEIGDIHASEYRYTVPGTQAADSTHSIQVKAVNEAGASEWSPIYSATLLPGGGGSITPKPVPSVPQPAVSATGASIIVLGWNKVDNAGYYQLEADGNLVYAGTDTVFIHTGLPTNSEHQYRVCAGNLSGVSEWSAPITVRTGAGEALAPSNISYLRKGSTVTTITWDMVSGATGYRIEINGNMQGNIITDTKTDISTTAGTLYNIRIASIMPEGEGEAPEWSEELTFRTPGEIPAAMTIGAVAVSSDAVTITWSGVSLANGYELEADGQIYDAGNSTSYRMTGYLPSTSHTFRIRAYNESGAGDWSEGKTVMTNSGIPGVPINITGGPVAAATTSTGSAIKIRWDALGGVSSYQVEDTNGIIYTTNTNSITIGNLIPGTNYSYRIRALSDSGTGAWSSRITVTPVLMTPTGLCTSAIEGGIRISWDLVGGAQRYELMIDGIVVAATEETGLDFDYNMFFVRREIRVRACYEDQFSEWSAKTIYDQPQTVSTLVTAGEEFSIMLPVANVDIKKYQLTLSFNSEELELLDACELTPQAELSSVYIEALNTNVYITTESSVIKLIFTVDQGGEPNWTGLASGITLRSKITGKVTLHYGVTLR